MKPCMYCGTETTNPKYCSLSCGAKAQPRPKMTRVLHCPVCKEEFDNVGQPNKKFCSRRCSATYNNSLRTRKKVDCLNCGGAVNVGHGSIYCSTKCHKEDQTRISLQRWLETGIATVSSSPGHYIRKYIFDEQKGICALCPTPNVWYSKELRFILDHIDGNSENNKRENLRLVCPNCDSQLDTYKSKNIGNGRHSRRLRYINEQSY